jgi:hypothetical protein
VSDTLTYRHRDQSVDQQLALRTAAARLGREFDGTDGTQTIERFLHTSYSQFASRSTIPNFLPLLGRTLRPATAAGPGPSRGPPPRR